MARGNSSILIESDNLDFYKHYLSFMKPISPISQLRDKQIEILAALLYKRNEITGKVKDPSLIPKLLFSLDTRNSIMQICNISDMNYYGIVGVLRRLNIIVNGDLSRKIIPELVNDKFTLIVSFSVKEDKEINTLTGTMDFKEFKGINDELE